MSHANKMRTVIQQVLVVFSEELAGECFFLLRACLGVGEDLQPRAAQGIGNVISGLACVPKDGNFSTGLGKHQSKCSGLRFQNQGEADAATREQVGNAANRGLGDGHERTGPRNALGVPWSRNWGTVGGVDPFEGTGGCDDGNCTRVGARLV